MASSWSSLPARHHHDKSHHHQNHQNHHHESHLIIFALAVAIFTTHRVTWRTIPVIQNSSSKYHHNHHHNHHQHHLHHHHKHCQRHNRPRVLSLYFMTEKQSCLLLQQEPLSLLWQPTLPPSNMIEMIFVIFFELWKLWQFW